MSLVVDNTSVAVCIVRFWTHYHLAFSRAFGKSDKDDIMDFFSKNPRLGSSFVVAEKASTAFLKRKVSDTIDDGVISTLKIFVHLYEESLRSGVIKETDIEIFEPLVKDMENTVLLFSHKGAADGLVN